MKAKILVIEDDGSVTGLLEDVLREEGFEVLVERDGEWGLRTFEQRSPDVVLLDILLPKLQGFDLLPRLRALPGGARTPIIVMSGVFRRATYQEKLAREHGVAAYLDKPIDTEVLCAELRAALPDTYPTPAPRARPSATAPRPERARPPVTVPDRGRIEDIPFARLLGRCVQARMTGALMLRRSTVKKIVYFKEGVPVFIRSNLLDECLGRVMVEERLITQEECDRSLRLKSEHPNKRQGELLIEMGCISQHNLQFALELQTQEKLFELFSWQDGVFQMNALASYDGPQVALSMSPAAVIYEGATRAMSTERIRRDLRAVSTRPLLASPDPTFRYQAQQLDRDAARLLEKIDGDRNVAEVLSATSLNPHDAALLLYALLCAGLLYASEGPEEDLDLVTTAEIDVVDALEQADHGLADALASSDASPAGESSAPPGSSGPSEAGRERDPEPIPDDVEGAPEPPPEPRAQDAAAAVTPSAPRARSVPAVEAVVGEAPRTDTLEAPLEEAEGLIEAPSARESSLGDVEVDESRPSEDAEAGSEARAVEAPPAPGAEVDLEETDRPAPPSGAAEPSAPPSSVGEARPAPRPSPTGARRAPEGLSLNIEEERERVESELRREVDALDRKNFYERLGVPEDAPTEVIEEAFAHSSAMLSPERALAGLTGSALQLLAERRVVLVRRAHATHTRPEARHRYDRREGLGAPAETSAVLGAEEDFLRGLEAAEEERWSEARDAFEDATRKSPEEGVYASHLAWAGHRVDPTDDRAREASLELLRRAAELNPLDTSAYLFEGRILRDMGRVDAALQAFERALRCDSDNVEAQQALRALRPAEPRSGLLSMFSTRP